MKLVAGSVLTFLALLLRLPTVHGSSTSMPPNPSIGDISAEGILDRRLLAIASDPSLLKKIDQKVNFRRAEVYSRYLQKSLDCARRFVPDVVGRNGATNVTASVCLADARVYFWCALDDRDVIGWVPLWGFCKISAEKKKIVLWVVPRLGRETSLAKKWRERVRNDDASSAATLIKAGLNVSIVDPAKVNGRQMQGIVEVAGDSHRVKASTEGNVLQTEIMLHPNQRPVRPGKPIMDGSVLKWHPIGLPFWPPE